MTWRVGVAALSLALAVLLSPPAHSQSGRSWLNGFVFADSDTRGLQGAKVELDGDPSWARLREVHLSAITESDGKYALKDVPYGLYIFRVSAAGYRTYKIPLYVASDMLTQIHVRLEKKPTTESKEH